MTKEEIYDTEISPLMAKILDICKRNKIAMLADFRIPNDDDPSLKCTSAVLTDDCEPGLEQIEAMQVLRPSSRVRMSTITVRDKDGASINKDIIATIE